MIAILVNDTQKDIIWIKRDNPEQELLEMNSTTVSGKVAALPIKSK